MTIYLNYLILYKKNGKKAPCCMGLFCSFEILGVWYMPPKLKNDLSSFGYAFLCNKVEQKMLTIKLDKSKKIHFPFVKRGKCGSMTHFYLLTPRIKIFYKEKIKKS